VKINGVPFERNPLIGLPNEKGFDVRYKYNYEALMTEAVGRDKDYQDSMFRQLILNDLWFVVYFIVKPFAEGNHKSFNHPFLVRACREVQSGPKDCTLDMWARFHYKTSIITIGETLQDMLRKPEEAVGLFAYKRAIATQKYIFQIKRIIENEKILYDAFEDVIYQDPERESPLWSVDGGLILKRKSNRGEPSVSGHGLVEGMPTSMHFEVRKYDDITTEDMADSPNVMEDVKVKFDSSQNLGMADGGSHRVIGTVYHHNDPLCYVRDKKDIFGNNMYVMRLKPATHDGMENGTPVLISQATLDRLKATKTFRSQQLLNPTPEGTQKLNPDFLMPIEPQFIPKELYKFMVIDQAGDLASNINKMGEDSWAIAVVGVEPKMNDIGASARYILDLFISPMSESEAIDQIVRMYLNAGMIRQVGVEKVGISTTHIHIANALRARGRYITEDANTLVLLRPAGRNKIKFIESSWSWPLNNSRMFYSRSCPNAYIDRLKNEMSMFPYWHDDGINAIAYLDDMIKDFRFPLTTYSHKPIAYREIGVV